MIMPTSELSHSRPAIFNFLHRSSDNHSDTTRISARLIFFNHEVAYRRRCCYRYFQHVGDGRDAEPKTLRRPGQRDGPLGTVEVRAPLREETGALGVAFGVALARRP